MGSHSVGCNKNLGVQYHVRDFAAVDWNRRDDQKGGMGSLVVSGILTDAGTAMNRSEDIHRSVDVGGVGLV